MLRITRRLEGSAPSAAQAQVSLPWDLRQRSRLRVNLDDGREAALALPRGLVLRDGDLLQTEDGLVVRVGAAREELSLAPCPSTLQLAQACYHLGNRHVPVQIRPDGVLYQRDHVLDQMLRGLGLEPRPVTAAFEPEGGAYHGRHEHHNAHRPEEA